MGVFCLRRWPGVGARSLSIWSDRPSQRLWAVHQRRHVHTALPLTSCLMQSPVPVHYIPPRHLSRCRGNNDEFLTRCTKLAERRKWSQLLQAFKSGLAKVELAPESAAAVSTAAGTGDAAEGSGQAAGTSAGAAPEPPSAAAEAGAAAAAKSAEAGAEPAKKKARKGKGKASAAADAGADDVADAAAASGPGEVAPVAVEGDKGAKRRRVVLTDTLRWVGGLDFIARSVSGSLGEARPGGGLLAYYALLGHRLA